jgi:ArsR family transcriptional regulator
MAFTALSRRSNKFRRPASPAPPKWWQIIRANHYYKETTETIVKDSLSIVKTASLTFLTPFDKNGPMPRITQPHDDAWSAEVEAAVATFGNRARNEILRFLSAHGPASRGDIVAAVSAGEPSVAKHLLALEDAGAVVVDVEPGRRHGRSPRYSANPERIRELLAAHLEYLLED